MIYKFWAFSFWNPKSGNFAAGSKEEPFSGKTEVVGGDRNLTHPALVAVYSLKTFPTVNHSQWCYKKTKPCSRKVGR